MAVVYHWKHGWIPLDHEAALKKAHGDKSLAGKMLADAPHAKGITSRQDIAKATMDLPNLHRPQDRLEAKGAIAESADKLGAHDLLPHRLGGVAPSESDLRKAAATHGVSSPQFMEMLAKHLGRKPTADDIVRARHSYGTPLNRSSRAGR